MTSMASADHVTGLGQKLTKPPYTERIPDRIANFAAVLTQHPEVYHKFRQLADEYQRRNPGQPFSSELIVSVMRFRSSVRVEDDQFAINANLKPLLARLYLIERQDAPIEKRNAWLDHLSQDEWGQILAAWQR